MAAAATATSISLKSTLVEQWWSLACKQTAGEDDDDEPLI